MISAEELEKVAKKMVETGETAQLKNGDLAIPVALSTSSVFMVKSRDERKKMLLKQFQEKLDTLADKGLEVDFGSISVSGQTVEAKLSLQFINAVLAELKEQKLDIYPVRKQQVQ